MNDIKLKDINVNDKERGETSEKQCVVLKDDKLDSLAHLDDLLSKKFGVGKNKIEEIKNDLTATCLKTSQCNSRLADTINIEEANKIHIGPIINITQQIVLTTERKHLNLEYKKLRDYNEFVPMVDRTQWMAQSSASEIRYLEEPAFYVIICHTSTDLADTQAENCRIIRQVQAYHIENKGWADIAYNFCIGCDSTVYEGRGWFAQGSHTMTYNAYSVGIAFIGHFEDTLPPPTALKKCKDLIAHGIQIGAVDPNYELIGHCQCRPLQSPGNCLFNEISTWDHFNHNINNTVLCKKLKW